MCWQRMVSMKSHFISLHQMNDHTCIAHTHTHTHTHTRTDEYVYVHICIYVYVFVYMYISRYIDIYIYICICIRTYIHMYKHELPPTCTCSKEAKNRDLGYTALLLSLSRQQVFQNSHLASWFVKTAVELKPSLLVSKTTQKLKTRRFSF